jgi:hypothetical protein
MIKKLVDVADGSIWSFHLCVSFTSSKLLRKLHRCWLARAYRLRMGTVVLLINAHFVFSHLLYILLWHLEIYDILEF